MSEQTTRRRLSAGEATRLRVNLVRVAWLAAGLGLLMQAILIVGGQATATIASTLDNGLWPFLVCMAVGVGQALSGGWPPGAATFSLITTPLGFVGAKVIQKGVAVLLDGVAATGFVTGALLLEGGLRALEYAVLAALLAWLIRQQWAGALAHMGLGLAVGIVFGLLIALFLAPDSFLGWIVEEVVFPTGCALIVFVSDTLVQLLPEDTVPKTPA